MTIDHLYIANPSVIQYLHFLDSRLALISSIPFILFYRKSPFASQSLYVSIGSCLLARGYVTHEKTLLGMRFIRCLAGRPTRVSSKYQ